MGFLDRLFHRREAVIRMAVAATVVLWFCYWLFRRRNYKNDRPNQIRLDLQHPPTPDHAAKLAEVVVKATREVDCAELDNSPSSLVHVDKIILRFHAKGLRPDQIGETIFSFGCYVGEVMVRNNGGVWKMPRDINLPEGLLADDTTMVIKLPNGNIVNPIGKAFKLLEQGEGDSLAFFYRVFAGKE